MSKSEKIKEEIGWLKLVFAVCVALGASLVGWLAQNYATANGVIISVGAVGAVGLASIVFYTRRRIYQRLQELEDA